MRNANRYHTGHYYLLMHFIIFLWGFTAVLGKLISLNALALTWWRVGLSVLVLWIYKRLKNIRQNYSRNEIKFFLLLGFLLSLHWLAFFGSIKAGNVSLTLVTMSVSAFFTSLLEPWFYKRPFRWYEMFFGLLIVGGLAYIFTVEHVRWLPVLLALGASLAGVLFTLVNGRVIHRVNAVDLSFYQLLFAFGFLSVFLMFSGNPSDIFALSLYDFLWLILLSTVCTAFAYTASLEILKKISPYTLILSVNLEPVYGIILALIFFGDSERMSFRFYVGSALILLIVTLEAWIKMRGKTASIE